MLNILSSDVHSCARSIIKIHLNRNLRIIPEDSVPKFELNVRAINKMATIWRKKTKARKRKIQLRFLPHSAYEYYEYLRECLRVLVTTYEYYEYLRVFKTYEYYEYMRLYEYCHSLARQKFFEQSQWWFGTCMTWVRFAM